MPDVVRSQPASAPERATLLVRFVAAVLDLLIVFFASLPLAPHVPNVVLLAIYFVVRYGTRHLFGATPAQWVIGLRVVDRTTYARTTPNRQWLRALAGFIATVYLGLTFSAGFLISELTDEKLSPRIVALRPDDVARPQGNGGGDRHTFERLSVSLPGAIGSWHGDLTHCCVLYAGEVDEDVVTAGVMVYASNDLHPYDYCDGVRGETVRFLSGCTQTPLQYQHRISSVTRRDRWMVWNPLEAVRTNFALVAKSIYFEDADPSAPIRRFQVDGAEVLWLRGRRTVIKSKEKASVEIDRFLIASPTQYGSLDVVWRKTTRDETMLNEIASSLTLSDQPATSGTSPLLARMNAWRRDTNSGATAEALRVELAKSGTARERKSFATWVESRAKQVPALASVAAETATWR
jgi:uncharacterized RDD family membrane protein YckC